MAADVAEGLENQWRSEDIPDEHELYVRVHRGFLDEAGEPLPGAFRNQPPEKEGGTGMSTDWQKYSAPQEIRLRAGQPADNAVIEMVAGEVRKIPGQTIIHTPDAKRNNRAHTDVVGPKKAYPEVRLKLQEASRVVIRLGEPVTN